MTEISTLARDHRTAAAVDHLVLDHRILSRAISRGGDVSLLERALARVETRLREILGEAEAAALLAGDPA